MAIDILFGVLLLLGAWHGFRKGFAHQVLQLAGLGLAVLFADPMAAWLEGWTTANYADFPVRLHRPLLYFAGLVLIWLAVTLPGSIYLSRFRRKVMGSNTPSAGDRFFGIGVGVVKGAFIVMLMAFLLRNLPQTLRESPPVQSQLAASRSLAVTENYRVIEPLLETREVQRFRQHVATVMEQWKVMDDRPVEDAIDLPEAIPPLAN